MMSRRMSTLYVVWAREGGGWVVICDESLSGAEVSSNCSLWTLWVRDRVAGHGADTHAHTHIRAYTHPEKRLPLLHRQARVPLHLGQYSLR